MAGSNVAFGMFHYPSVTFIKVDVSIVVESK